MGTSTNIGLCTVSRRSRELFGLELKCLLTNCNPLVLKSWSFNMFLTERKKNKRIGKFDDSEPWCCEDIKQIVAPEIGAEGFGTFENPKLKYRPGARFSKVPKTFRARKLRPSYSLKLVFLYVVKEIKIKISAKVRASRRLRVEVTKRIMSPKLRPKRLRNRPLARSMVSALTSVNYHKNV